MKETRLLMGMPITVEIADQTVAPSDIDVVFDYFAYVDATFSTYKSDSEITRINAGQLRLVEASADMQTVFRLAEQTKQETHGYFDILRDGRYDPSGLVKGWAIQNAAELLRQRGRHNFYVEAGGDIQADGLNNQQQRWHVGIRSPFNLSEIVKVLALSDQGIATSGNYVRGAHIYNPHDASQSARRRLRKAEIVSLTVIGPNVYEADRFATAAFAMGHEGIVFIERLAGFEGYMIDEHGRATLTSGFESYVYDSVD